MQNEELMAVLIVITVSGNPSQTGFFLDKVRYEKIRKLFLAFRSPKTCGRPWLAQEHYVPGGMAVGSVTWFVWHGRVVAEIRGKRILAVAGGLMGCLCEGCRVVSYLPIFPQTHWRSLVP